MSGYIDNGDGPRLWVIVDRAGVFWRPGGQGYTSRIEQAGLFSESFARRLTGPGYQDRFERAAHLLEWRADLVTLVDQGTRALALLDAMAGG